MIQGSEEWFAARLGKVTASEVVNILPGKSGKYLAARDKYLHQCLCERLVSYNPERFSSAAMKWGTETEDLARAAYSGITGRQVRQVGLIDHPTIIGLAASPDGISDPDRGLEIKCPNTTTHMALVLSQEIDPAHIVQMHVGMMCSGLDLWEYINYDPDLNESIGFYRKTIEKDPAMIEQITNEVGAFLEELDAAELKVREMMQDGAA